MSPSAGESQGHGLRPSQIAKKPHRCRRITPGSNTRRPAMGQPETFLGRNPTNGRGLQGSPGLHPDDPPWPASAGRTGSSPETKLSNGSNLAPSPYNGLCYCQGALAPAGVAVEEGIRKLAPHIHYAHFRNVSGTADHFRETFHDNGDLDMAALMRAFKESGFRGPMRPDHAPSLAGETNETPGYETLGKLHAIGYMKASTRPRGKKV